MTCPPWVRLASIIVGVGRRGRAGERLSRAGAGLERAGDVRGGVGGGPQRREEISGSGVESGVRAQRYSASVSRVYIV